MNKGAFPFELRGMDTLSGDATMSHCFCPLSFVWTKLEDTFSEGITKTCLCYFDPLKRHFYIVKLGFTGVYRILLISAQKHSLWVLVRTASQRQF